MNKARLNLSAVIFGIIVILTGCAPPTSPTTLPSPSTLPAPTIPSGSNEAPAGLENIVWVLEAMGDTGKLRPVMANSEITIRFDAATARCDGSAGVNRYFGGYSVKNDTLRITSPIGSTMMAGPEPLMAQETAYLSVLGTAEDFKIEGGKLTISGRGKELIFKKK